MGVVASGLLGDCGVGVMAGGLLGVDAAGLIGEFAFDARSSASVVGDSGASVGAFLLGRLKESDRTRLRIVAATSVIQLGCGVRCNRASERSA